MDDKIIKDINVYGKSCIGCQKTNSDIMVSFRLIGKEEDFNDIFLTTEQAEYLLKWLEKRLEQNKND